MPAQPTWFVRLPKILATLRALHPMPYLDRQAFEYLFGVKHNQARILMQRFQGQQIGHAWTVDRLQLIAALEGLYRGETFQWERQRRQRIAEFTRQAEQEHSARQISIPILQTSKKAALDSLPSGIHFTAGEVRIQFSSLSDFLSKLFAVGQALQDDIDSFGQFFPA